MKHPSSQVLTGVEGASLCLDNGGRDPYSVSKSLQWSHFQAPVKVNSSLLLSRAWPLEHGQSWERSPALSPLGSTELVLPNEIYLMTPADSSLSPHGQLVLSLPCSILAGLAFPPLASFPYS